MSAKLWLLLLSLSAHLALFVSLLLWQTGAEPAHKNKETITLTLAPRLRKEEPIAPVPEMPAFKKVNTVLKQAAKKAVLLSRSENFLAPSKDVYVMAMPAEAESEVAAKLRPKPFLLNGDAVRISYPPKARYLKVEGSVHLMLTIAENGEVKKAVVLSGPAFGLRQAAASLVKKLRFLPAIDEHGTAVVSEITHEVIFRLKDQFPDS